MSDDGSHIERQYYCTEAAIPIRSSPSEASEMTSQLIYGDFAFHLEEKDSWTRIKCKFDGYEGWVDSKMLRPVNEGYTPSNIEWKWVKRASLEFPNLLHRQALPLGARVAKLKVPAGSVWDPRPEYISLGSDSVFFEEDELGDLAKLASYFYHVPYLWGGSSSNGIDCSGLTQRVYRMAGRKLPRDSRDQEKLGLSISFEDRRPGDLAFFTKARQEKITHVGLVLDKDDIIHASGHVRIDKLTSTGIIHSEAQILTHELISIKR